MDAQLLNDVDFSYISEFPDQRGWESAAVGILLSYENACSESPPNCDHLKYGVMHALRWGRNVDSCPLADPMAPLPDTFLHSCTSTRRLGNEFVGVFACRKRFERGVFHLQQSDGCHLCYCCDPTWFAFDYLDEKLEELDAPAFDEVSSAVHEMLSEILNGLHPNVNLPSFFRTRTDAFRKHRAVARRMYHRSIEMPCNWQYGNVSLGSLRHVWDSLGLLALAHIRAAAQCQYSENDPRRLILWRRSELVQFLSETSGEPEAAEVAIQSLTYCRELSPPDIALQPFVPVNDEWIIGSSWMIVSSNFARNFFAVIARRDSAAWDNASNSFAGHMGDQLAAWIKGRGYRAATKVKVSDDSGNQSTDLDLVVWSPDEHFVVTAELKWMIQVADLMEVLNRGEKECDRKLREQLPKHRTALTSGADRIIHQAFGEHAQVDMHDSLLVCQGFVGTPRLPSEFPCVDERVFRLAIQRCDTLREAMEWLRSREWLPRVREHFYVNDMTIQTPHGIRLTFPEPVFPS